MRTSSRTAASAAAVACLTVAAGILLAIAGPRPVTACSVGAWPTVGDIRASGAVVVHARVAEVVELAPYRLQHRLTVIEVLQGESTSEIMLRGIDTSICGDPLWVSRGQEVVLAIDVPSYRGIASPGLDPYWEFDSRRRVADSTVASSDDPTHSPERWIGTDVQTILALFRTPDTATMHPDGATRSLAAAVIAVAGAVIAVVVAGMFVRRLPARRDSRSPGDGAR